MTVSHRRLRTFARAAALATASLLLAPSAFAQAFDAVRLYGVAPGTDGGLAGLALIAGTQYAGSDERRTLLVPLLDYQWRNGWFAGTGNGVGFNFASRPDQQYGLRITGDFGRKAKRSTVLTGMGDIGAKAEFGGFFNYALTHEVFISSSLRYGAGDRSNGLVVDLGAGYSTSLAPQWRLGVGGAVSLINAGYEQSYFGVTPAQAISSGHAQYTPGAGLRDARANLALTHQINARTAVTAVLSSSTLLGDAKNSPLVRQQTTVNGVLGLTYGF